MKEVRVTQQLRNDEWDNVLIKYFDGSMIRSVWLEPKNPMLAELKPGSKGLLVPNEQTEAQIMLKQEPRYDLIPASWMGGEG